MPIIDERNGPFKPTWVKCAAPAKRCLDRTSLNEIMSENAAYAQ